MSKIPAKIENCTINYSKISEKEISQNKTPNKKLKIEIIKTFCCTAQVRYHQEMINCEVKILSNGNCEVEFEKPVRAIALGQSVVFYDDQIMLGGGIIDQKLD